MKKCIYIILLIGITPILVHAQGNGIVQCGRNSGEVCGWLDLLGTLQRLLDSVLVYIAIPIAIIVVIVGGFQMIFSGGNEGKFKKGVQMIRSVAIGLAITFGAWVIVQTILKLLF